VLEKSVGMAFWFRYWPSDRGSGQREEVILVRLNRHTHGSSLDSATGFLFLGWVTNWPIVPAPDDECGAVGGMRMAEETGVLGDNLPQYHFDHNKSHMT
jgi:hypothetical protein